MSEFDRCAPWLQAALAEGFGTHSIDDVRAAIGTNHAQIWPNERGAMVTEIINFPQRRVVNVFLAGGELDQILAMENDATAWGKSIGATGAMLSGRKGWERVLAPRGWRHLYTVMGKDF